MHFHCTTCMATPYHINPYPRGHEIYNLGRPFLGHHCYALSECELYLGVEKKIFKEIHCSLFTPKLPPLWGAEPRVLRFCHTSYLSFVNLFSKLTSGASYCTYFIKKKRIGLIVKIEIYCSSWFTKNIYRL